jgi:hypothetical protein
VKPARKKSRVDLSWLRSSFDLAPDERKFVAGILAIALVGLVARYVHLKNQKPEPVAPEGVEQAAQAGEL